MRETDVHFSFRPGVNLSELIPSRPTVNIDNKNAQDFEKVTLCHLYYPDICNSYLFSS